jgi:hypothetical protein
MPAKFALWHICQLSGLAASHIIRNIKALVFSKHTNVNGININIVTCMSDYRRGWIGDSIY